MELLLDAVNGLVLILNVCNIESSRVVGVPLLIPLYLENRVEEVSGKEVLPDVETNDQ